ncbi:MAG: hypothetical protein QM214_06765 [Bacillota bacterium]|jgi:4-diphosphocytidyl-2-C-methyl-D-erythritol kinase|nr:hypothetical protein [Bacillota bacterium]HHU43085.1 hypothetical protein [Clostridiales bacterium]
MKDIVTKRIYAKINLCLAIKGICEDMHIIDTVVTNIGVFDEITVKKRNDDQILISYDNLKERIENDTAEKAAKLLQQEYSLKGADITIKKNIPFSAGLGGSSADSAGVAKCMEELYGLRLKKEILLKMGSDVPYMYQGGMKRIRGLGETIHEVSLPPLKYAVLVCPGGMNTKEAYELYDKIGGDNPDVDEFLENINSGRPYILYNALQKAAIRLNPNIKTGLKMLKQSGFSSVVMTGSGSAVIGVEQDEKKFLENAEMLKRIINNDYKLLLT